MFDNTDPRLTAYVLNELEAEERAQLDAALAESPMLREEVESLRATADWVTAAFVEEPPVIAGSSDSCSSASCVLGYASRGGASSRWLALAAALSLLVGLVAWSAPGWRRGPVVAVAEPPAPVTSPSSVSPPATTIGTRPNEEFVTGPTNGASSTCCAKPTCCAHPNCCAKPDTKNGIKPTVCAAPTCCAKPTCSSGEVAGATAFESSSKPSPSRRVVIANVAAANAATLGSVRERETPSSGPKEPRSWRPAGAAPNAVRLSIGDQDDLPLAGQQFHVVIDGFRARVLIDLFFRNDRAQRLEGSFRLRLPDEASLYYFAFGESSLEHRPQESLVGREFFSAKQGRLAGTGPLEIAAARRDSWTQVKEARLVPRDKAAHAYGEVVRQRVDPALVEWSGAGVFQARVFPLQPGKLHRIVVGYDVNLAADGEDLTYRLDLPSGVPEQSIDLDLAATPGTTVEIEPESRPFVSGGRAFYRWQPPATGPLHVRLRRPGTLLLTGRDEAGSFFATRFTPPPETLASGEERDGASHAVFLLDTSLSGRPEKFYVWLRLLEATLERNRGSLRRFAVLFFDIEQRWWRPGYSDNTPETVAALLADSRRLVLEGATDVHRAIDEAARPEWRNGSPAADKSARPELFVLSDGAATWGETDGHWVDGTAAVLAESTGPVFAYHLGESVPNGGPTSDSPLGRLCAATGGAVFSVTSADEVSQAATAHRRRPWEIVGLRATGGTDLLLAGRPRFVYPGQPLLVAGRGTGGDISLELRRDSHSRTFAIRPDRTIDSALAPRLYGQLATSQLEALGATADKVAVAFARHFRVAGETCSLLMLESEADYQRFQVRPEDDVLVVTTSPVDPFIRRQQAEPSKASMNAKARVLAWLEQLERAPGLQFSVATPLRLVLDQMPAKSFDVPRPRLVCRSRDAAAEYVRALAESGEQRAYDAVVAEAERRRAAFGAADGMKALSNLLEHAPGDAALTQEVAFVALESGLSGEAFPLLWRLAESRPFEPQLPRLMAHCLVELGQADWALVVYEVLMSAEWNARHPDMRAIAAWEFAHLLRRIERGELSSSVPEYARARGERLAAQFDVAPKDLVVTVQWNTDRTDVDLHVSEPDGSECSFRQPRTKNGRLTRDVTQGFGPEMYVVTDAPPGPYVAFGHYYSADPNRMSTRTRVYLTVVERFDDEEVLTRKSVLLEHARQRVQERCELWRCESGRGKR